MQDAFTILWVCGISAAMTSMGIYTLLRREIVVNFGVGLLGSGNPIFKLRLRGASSFVVSSVFVLIGFMLLVLVVLTFLGDVMSLETLETICWAAGFAVLAGTAVYTALYNLFTGAIALGERIGTQSRQDGET